MQPSLLVLLPGEFEAHAEGVALISSLDIACMGILRE